MPFSGYSVDDIPAAKRFYAETLGIRVTEENGNLTLHLAGGDRPTLVYPKGDAHEPASFTVLNFPVDRHRGHRRRAQPVAGSSSSSTRAPTSRPTTWASSRGGGPLIAWFKDPAGNVLSVIKADEAQLDSES